MEVHIEEVLKRVQRRDIVVHKKEAHRKVVQKKLLKVYRIVFQKKNNLKLFFVGRSQSVGPIQNQNESSPKRQNRLGSTAVNNTTATSNAVKPQKKTPVSTPTTAERRPRPSK